MRISMVEPTIEHSVEPRAERRTAERTGRRLIIALVAIGIVAGLALSAMGVVLFLERRLVPGIIATLAAASWLVPLLALALSAHRRARVAAHSSDVATSN